MLVQAENQMESDERKPSSFITSRFNYKKLVKRHLKVDLDIELRSRKKKKKHQLFFYSIAHWFRMENKLREL